MSNCRFDPDACYQAGNCPWTFFAYPKSFADEHGLPLDDEAKRLLSELESCGLRVGVWQTSPASDSCYFACPQEEISLVNRGIRKLEERGVIEPGFCTKRCEQLFALSRLHHDLPRDSDARQT